MEGTEKAEKSQVLCCETLTQQRRSKYSKRWFQKVRKRDGQPNQTKIPMLVYGKKTSGRENQQAYAEAI